MNLSRQHILLGLLVAIGLFQGGDYILNSMIQGPLDKLRSTQESLEEEIAEKKKLLSEARVAGKQIELWKKKSLPADIETARSLYRNWLLSIVRRSKLQNATVGSGAPSTRYGLYRAMPFDLKARGSLSQLTAVLFQFTSSDQLHEIKSLRISPIGSTGQYDISLGIEAIIIPGNKRKSLSTAVTKNLVSNSVRDYSVIARDNIFGIGVNHQDPMKATILSAVTIRNGKPVAWFTNQLNDRIVKVGPEAEFETLALSGRVVEIQDEEVIFESGGQKLKIMIGQSFSQAVPVPSS